VVLSVLSACFQYSARSLGLFELTCDDKTSLNIETLRSKTTPRSSTVYTDFPDLAVRAWETNTYGNTRYRGKSTDSSKLSAESWNVEKRYMLFRSMQTSSYIITTDLTWKKSLQLTGESCKLWEPNE